jgi:hypothetical protein
MSQNGGFQTFPDATGDSRLAPKTEVRRWLNKSETFVKVDLWRSRQ